MQVEGNWVNLIVFASDGDYAGDRIFRSVSLNYDRDIGDPMCQNGGGSKSYLEVIEGRTTIIREIPWHSLSGELS